MLVRFGTIQIHAQPVQAEPWQQLGLHPNFATVVKFGFGLMGLYHHWYKKVPNRVIRFSVRL
jgi:hypothetical protein